MGYYIRNAGLLGPGLQTTRTGVHDVNYSRIYQAPAAVIPTTDLYTHWDFSLLSDPVSTTYTTSGTAVPGSSGTSIGAVSTTPGITFYTTNSTYSGQVSSHGTNNNKCLYRPNATSTNNGAWFQSGTQGWLNPATSTSPWSYALVLVPITPQSTWNRVLRIHDTAWTEYQGSTLFLNNAGNYEVHGFTYTSGGSSGYYGSTGFTMTNNSLMIIMASVTGTALTVSYKSGANATINVSSTLSATEYGSSSSRVIFFGDSFYWNGNGAFKWCEFAWWNKSFTSAEQTSVISSLYTKWA